MIAYSPLHSLGGRVDTVGWVFWPVKTVARITYIVLEETLNPAQSMMKKEMVINCVQADFCMQFAVLGLQTLPPFGKIFNSQKSKMALWHLDTNDSHE